MSCRWGASCSAEPATLSQRSSGCGWTPRCFQCAVYCVLLTMRCRLWHVGYHVEVSLCTQVCCAWWCPLLQQSLCLPVFLLQSQLLLACIRALTEVYRTSYLWGALTGNTVYTEGSQPVISECLSHMLGLAALLCSAHRLFLDCMSHRPREGLSGRSRKLWQGPGKHFSIFYQQQTDGGNTPVFLPLRR